MLVADIGDLILDDFFSWGVCGTIAMK
jgi:hypothetical protein